MPGSTPSAEGEEGNNTHNNPCPTGADILEGQTDNKGDKQVTNETKIGSDTC